MTRTQKHPLVYLSLLLLLVVAGWKLWPSSSSVEVNKGPGDMSKLVNRVWIDAIPTTERDKIDVFLLLDEGNFGVFSKSSAYEGDWSAFQWSADKGLNLRMLQADKSYKVQTKVMSGAACAPFDYCLRIKGSPRGSKRYGSMEDWVINEKVEAVPSEIVEDLFFR